MNFVALEYAYFLSGPRKNQRKPKDPPLHIYDGEPPITLCGLAVPAEAYGWFATGCPIDDPAFPFGPLCTACVEKAPRGGVKSGQTGGSISGPPAGVSTGAGGVNPPEPPDSNKSGG